VRQIIRQPLCTIPFVMTPNGWPHGWSVFPRPAARRMTLTSCDLHGLVTPAFLDSWRDPHIQVESTPIRRAGVIESD